MSFQKARNLCCVIPVREDGVREWGREGGFVPKWNRGRGVRFESLCSSNQPVSAVGQVTTELIMLMNNLRDLCRYITVNRVPQDTKNLH